MHDGTNWEVALGTYGSGPPSTMTRPSTVLRNSAGTTSRINFPGLTNIYSAIPADRVVMGDLSNNVSFAGNIFLPASGYISPANTTSGLAMYGRLGGVTSTSGLILRGNTGGAGATASDGIEIYVDGSEMMRLDAAKAIIGAASQVDNARLTVQTENSSLAAIACVTNTTTNQTMIGIRNGNGVVGTIVANGSATAYNTSSDHRLKIDHGLWSDDLVLRLRVHDAEFRSNGARYPMFFAHEMQEDGASFCVTGKKDEIITADIVDKYGNVIQAAGEIVPQQVDAMKLIPALVATVQRLAADIATLKQITGG